MRRLIDRLPIRAVEQTVSLPGGNTVVIRPLQPIVWISLAPPQVMDLPQAVLRFPAVVDTGFNQTLLIQDTQVREWAGIDPRSLAVFPGETARYGSQIWPFRITDIWLHPVHADEQPSTSANGPSCLEIHPGILIVSRHERFQRLPVLGMRALAWCRAALQIVFDGPANGSISMDLPS